jgi:DNA transformation protein
MPKRSEFVEHVVELMRPFGPVEARSMFGGWGLYHQGLFFALVAEDTLYFKVDDEKRAAFEAQGGGAFVYGKRKGERAVMSYHRPPDDALDSPEVMLEWARMGYAAALRAAKRQKK